jgi:hypothetical protein
MEAVDPAEGEDGVANDQEPDPSSPEPSSRPEAPSGPKPDPAATVKSATATPKKPRGKICPTCGERYPNEAGFCGKDATKLVLIN